MKLFKILLFLISITQLVFSADPQKSVYVDVVNKHTYAGGDLTMQCPAMLPEFSARVNLYDYNAGNTICNVYGKNASGEFDYTKVLDKVTEHNPYVQAYMNAITQNEEKTIRQDLENDYKINPGDNLGIKSAADTWFHEYTDTPETFMTTSKMLISALTLDGDVIDLDRTLNTNTLTTTSEYTQYPNISQGDPTQKIFDTLMQAAKDRGDIDEAISEYHYNQSFNSSHAKDVMGELYVLIVDFFASFNELYRKILFWVFILSALFTLLFFFQNKSTRSASKLHKQEDPYERFIVGALLVFFFFIPTTTHELSNGDKIQQTYSQTGSRQMLYFAMDWGDEATKTLSKVYLNYIYKKTGNFSASQLLNLKKEGLVVDKKLQQHKNVLTICDTYYDENKMQKEPGYTPTKIYPAGRKDDWVLLKDAYVNNQGSYPAIPTLNACSNALRSILILEEQKRGIDSNLLAFEQASKKSLTRDRLRILSEGILKQTASNGVASVPLIGASDGFFKASELLSTPYKKIKAESDLNAANGNIAEGSETEEGGFTSISYYSQNAAYMMLPGFSNFRATIWETLKINPPKNKEGWINKLVSLFKGGFFRNTWNSVVLALSTLIPLWFYQSFIEYLPVLGIIVGSFLTLTFYFISVQIFYILLPFFAAYSFTANQPHVLTNALSKFLLISLRPVILVISVLIALLAVSIFQGILNYVIDPFFNLFNAMLGQLSFETMFSYGFSWENITGWFGDVASGFFVGAIKGIVHIFVGIAIFYATFYITFYAADIFSSLFGIKDKGHDIQETVGNPIDSGTSSISKPI